MTYSDIRLTEQQQWKLWWRGFNFWIDDLELNLSLLSHTVIWYQLERLFKLTSKLKLQGRMIERGTLTLYIDLKDDRTEFVKIEKLFNCGWHILIPDTSGRVVLYSTTMNWFDLLCVDCWLNSFCSHFLDTTRHVRCCLRLAVPDLSAIKHLWDELDCHVRQRNHALHTQGWVVDKNVIHAEDASHVKCLHTG